MIHPDTKVVEIGGPLGHAVVAKTLIPKGTIIWSLGPDDIVLEKGSPELERPELKEELPRHAFVDSKGRYVFCRDTARYMNHSCEPSTTSLGILCDVALRDIQPGEPLTCDYGLLNLDYEFDCACGAPTCRGVVSKRGLKDRAAKIDVQLAPIVGLIAKVPQPLRPLMLDHDQQRLGRILKGQESVPSILENAVQG